ncbi:hypothetical protein [Gluconobacter frateurii]|uniref:Uncharacterized protein n=1 Tax=Gluconobacter frateurii NRIC 0228 TaxID=1307946 RepID=A0ABQ0Q9C2_9PROT|nr:hypothetical protein [Gluconobacter frateurii]GBR09819.1 hypothetical protein AA0228_0817 [Gluconobacter frateurii NRIC 0228]GLP91818.1 hypothetical protein GCM10007868_28930 [Gluconobacter frateurii]
MTVPRNRVRRSYGPPMPMEKRIKYKISEMAGKVALPLQRIKYYSGIDILCIAAQTGLDALRSKIGGLQKQLTLLPPNVRKNFLYDEGCEDWSEQDDVECDIDMAKDALNELRKAFCVAAYHHWERSVSEWYHAYSQAPPNQDRPSVKFPRGHEELENFCQSCLNISTHKSLKSVTSLVNLLKHNNKNRWQDVHREWPTIVPGGRPGNGADWSGTVRLTDEDLLRVFEVVRLSGPKRPNLSQSAPYEPLPFTPKPDPTAG